MELYEINIRLVAKNSGVIPFDAWELSRAMFFEALRISNQELAQKLHDSKDIKPFGVKPLRPKIRKKSKGGWSVNEGEMLLIGFGIAGKSLFNEFIIGLTRLENLRAGNVELAFESADVRDVTEKVTSAQPAGRIGIVFKTPTAFSVRGIPFSVPLPLPNLIVANLRNLWVNFMDSVIDEEIINWAKTSVRIKSYKCMTREVSIKGTKIVGFKGKVELVLENREYAKDLMRLLKLGEVLNVGIKRTFGMGVIEVSPLG